MAKIKERPARALSIKQPYARLICLGLKDIENRSWSTFLRGRIYIHASKISDHTCKWIELEKIATEFNVVESEQWNDFANWWSDDYYDNDPEFSGSGAIIGEVDIIDCITDSKSPWAVQGQYHFILANPKLYEKPIPYKGRLRLFEVNLTEHK